MEERHNPQNRLIRDLDSHPRKKSHHNNFMLKPVIFTVTIMLLLGIGTGYIASNVSGNGGSGPTSINSSSSDGQIKKGATFGVDDTKQFPDTAEGVLKDGGIEGEGAFHLERPGGESQNVYLTSAVVDLSKFIGKKVKVWGQTQAAKHAGWLMDVGKIEVK